VSLTRWLPNHLGLSLRPASRRNRRAARPTVRPTLQALEDRWLPSTLTVTTAADSGVGSLRAEIAASKLNDTIVFNPSLNGQTITLTSELMIQHSLTIAGPGPGNLTISGNFASRVFEVAQKQTNGTKVTLSGLTINDGVAHDHLGGGAIENWGVLTVSNCTLTGNSAPGASGGAIFNGGFSTMTVSGCTLSGNSASRGGAIDTKNAATVIGCTISGNTAAMGGGISNGVSTLTVDHCTVSGNVATSAGGGIYTDVYGTVTVKNYSSITGNTAPLGYGADVYNQSVLYLDSTSAIDILDGNPAVPIS
jgi:predicted outer membrane repeat protein